MLKRFLNWLMNVFMSVNFVPDDYRPSPAAPIWLVIAYKEFGVSEVIGGENSRIIEYHSVTTLKAKEDEVPWCASFVCWALEAAGIRSTKSARARDFLEWGVKAQPKEGAILVFDRGQGMGHVGFYIGENKDHYAVWGGNQGNRVCGMWYPKANLLSCRMPGAKESLQLATT